MWENVYIACHGSWELMFVYVHVQSCYVNVSSLCWISYVLVLGERG